MLNKIEQHNYVCSFLNTQNHFSSEKLHNSLLHPEGTDCCIVLVVEMINCLHHGQMYFSNVAGGRR